MSAQMAIAKAQRRSFMSRIGKARLPLLMAIVALLDVPAHAQRVDNAMAIFAALDKVTAAVRQLNVGLNQTGEFRTLRITPRACYTRAPTEPPRTSTFVEIDEILFDGKEKRIFTGWMFAESPGLNPLLHPVFDVWLTSCTQPQRAPAAAPSAKAPQQPPAPGTASPPNVAPQQQPPPDDDQPRRRRVPR
jgi:hypothetical protein